MKISRSRWITFTVSLIGMVGLGAASIWHKPAVPEPDHFRAKCYGRFSELPVGAVQPRGWIQKWLERQAQGLTGHPENMSYPYDTCMYACRAIPPAPYTNKWWSAWWPYEQSGYFVDGMTRLSWLVNDPAINQRRNANLDYILNNSTNGNLGPSHWCWPNAVVGRALLAQFSATGNPQAAQVLQSALLANANEITNRNAKEKFYLYRSGANFEEAFYLYGLTGDRRLLEIGRKVCDNYLNNTNSFCSVKNIQSNVPFHEHGVTAAETLKCFPLTFLYTGDERILRLGRRAYQKVVDNSLMADGGFVSAEYLDPSAFNSLHESCDITDWSWSLGYLFMATGEGQWADLVERATFNALPGAVTKDFKQLQYFSAVNQVVISATNSNTPHCATRMTYRAAHDTECCSGNINRAMPNYVSRMWMRSSSSGLAAVYYGPSEVTTTVGGQSITVTEETDYPFRDSISFRVKTARPVAFDLQCHIPQWCSNATIQVNGEPLRSTPMAGTFTVIRRKFHDGDVVNLKLPMSVWIENWFANQAVCVTRGPLVYSLEIAEKRVEHTSDPDDIKPLLRGHNIQGFPEVEFYPESDWRYGFAVPLKTESPKIRVVESDMTDNPFVENQAPVHLYDEKADYNSGIDVLEEARKLDPKDVELLYQIGVIYEKAGNTDKALQRMEEVLRLEPDNPNALNFIGYTWADKGVNLDKAEDMIKRALVRKPDDGYFMDSIGWVYYKKGDYRKALTEVLKAHQMIPEDPVIAEHVGEVYLSLKDFNKAIDFFEMSIKFEKQSDKKKQLEQKIKSIEDKKK